MNIDWFIVVYIVILLIVIVWQYRRKVARQQALEEAVLELGYQFSATPSDDLLPSLANFVLF